MLIIFSCHLSDIIIQLGWNNFVTLMTPSNTVLASRPPPTTALTCVLRCFPCEPTWAGSPFLPRPPTPPMGRMTRSKTFQAYLPSCHRTYSCIHCRAHLANHDELISKGERGLWPCRGEGPPHWSSRCGGHLL
ncbi:uncharacterized protein LOC130210524 isoform X3 [Pseudoliparis swirei]|uniref:uncharacterized protein LOC130210524 isoform X3 n=1 Tax=Pseudoliparis swirei TaxID=2059687 RepID=UPI0024BDEE42|nr:uncharacterized protein LOC130210524 isoform X3 [Pseudoliparis swirei]